MKGIVILLIGIVLGTLISTYDQVGGLILMTTFALAGLCVTWMELS